MKLLLIKKNIIMKIKIKSLGILHLLFLCLLVPPACFAQFYNGSYRSSVDISRNSIEQQCLMTEADSNADYKKHLHCRDSLGKIIALHEANLTKIKNAKIDSLNSQKEYLLENYPQSITRPRGTVFQFVMFGLIFIVVYICIMLIMDMDKPKTTVAIILGIVILIFYSWLYYYYYQKKELFWKVTAELSEAKNFSIDKDKTLVQLRTKQNKSEQQIQKLEDEIRLQIQPTVEKIYQQQLFQQDSAKKAEVRKLEQFIRKNSIRKELRVIACSWEKDPDIPEHGYIDGNLESSGSGGGAIILGIGGGGGKSKAKGTLKGEYTGRVYGNEYRYFHFVLSDNSYHVIDAINNKIWRMAVNRLVVRYEKIYSNYHQYTEKFTPLYNKTFN